MLRSRFRSLALPTAILMACTFASAQKTTPARITAPVIESERTRLLGNVSPLLRSLPDQGKASPAPQMTHVRLILSRTPQQQAALDAFLAQVQDKSSANYHKWLTPQQFGARYGASEDDIATIQTWLSGHGFKVEPVSPAHTTIAFSGSVSQVESAFETEIHSFTASGQNFVASTKNPSIPSALAKVVSGVARLNTLSPTPQHVIGRAGHFNPETKQLVPFAEGSDLGIHPQLTNGTGTSASLYVTAADAATIYDTPNSELNVGFTSGTNYKGTGVVIGIGGRSVIKPATVAAYRAKFLGDSTTPTITNIDGVTSIDDTVEAYIDTELSGGLAPGATIHYYTAVELFDAMHRAIDDNTIDIFSLSYGVCEAGIETATNTEINNLWQQAATQGIAVLVSTGDNGSAGCDPTSDGSNNLIAEAQYGLQVNALASTPYNIAVGGTDFYGLLSGFSTYVGDADSGTTANFYRSAKGFIPESTWNDSTQADGALGSNKPYTGADANIVGGSGGASSCSTSTPNICVSGYAKPTWQRGSGVPADSVRDLPDISLLAGNGYDSAAWLICTDDTFTQGGTTYTTNCVNSSTGGFAFSASGGTSTSAPAFAGILALVQEKTGSRLGQAASELYDLYNGSHASAIFHDTTVGNNSVSCTAGTPDCAKNTAGYYYLTGYNTTTGYDLATGLGSVDAKQLITYWGSAVGSQKPTITVTPSVTTVAPGQNVIVAVTLAGTTALGTPTGTVALGGGTYSSSATLSPAGTASFTISASKLVVGVNKLTASYSGNTDYAAATGSTNVTLTAPAVTLSPTSLSFSTAAGTTSTKTITVTNSGTAPLIITSITATGSASFVPTNNCSTVAAGANCTISVAFSPTLIGSATGTITIVDNALDTPQTVALTGTAVTSGTFTVAGSVPAAITKGATATSTITATGTGGYQGTIALTCSVAAVSGGTHTPTCTAGSSIVIGAGATSGTSTITLNTTAAAAAKGKLGGGQIGSNQTPNNGLRNWGSLGGIAVAGLLLFGIPARRRNLRAMLGVLVLCLAGLGALSLTGCGGGGSSTPKDPGTTAGAYTVTVTATDSAASITKTATVTLTVN